MVDIFIKIKEIFMNVLDDNRSDINLVTSLDELNINSISFIKLVIAIEEEFNITFEDEYLNNASFRNINEIVNYVKDRIVNQ